MNEEIAIRPVNIFKLLSWTSAIFVPQILAISGNVSIRLQGLSGSYTLKHMSFDDILIVDKKFWVVFISNLIEIIRDVLLSFTDIFSYFGRTYRNLLTVRLSVMLSRNVTRSVAL